MILPRGQELLLPASPWFIAASLLLGFLCNMLLNMGVFGNAAFMPDWLALVLIFWCVHQPRRIGMGWCFFFGLATDVHQAALLGQHALSFSVMGFLAFVMHRRMQWFTQSSQAPQVFLIFALGTSLDVLMRYVLGRDLPGWGIVLAPVFQAALWVPVSFLLLIPQRRAPDPDVHRPL